MSPEDHITEARRLRFNQTDHCLPDSEILSSTTNNGGFSSFNDQRTNFFEGNVVNYSKGSITFDDF